MEVELTLMQVSVEIGPSLSVFSGLALSAGIGLKAGICFMLASLFYKSGYKSLMQENSQDIQVTFHNQKKSRRLTILNEILNPTMKKS